MRNSSSFATLIFIVILAIGEGLAYSLKNAMPEIKTVWIWVGIIAFVVALIVSLAIKIADQWEKVVVLRLGTFRAIKGPRLFFIIPVIDTITG